MTLVLGGQTFAVEKKPCGPGEQEVMAKDRTTMCVKVYGARPESKGDVSGSRFHIGISFGFAEFDQVRPVV